MGILKENILKAISVIDNDSNSIKGWATSSQTISSGDWCGDGVIPASVTSRLIRHYLRYSKNVDV